MLETRKALPSFRPRKRILVPKNPWSVTMTSSRLPLRSPPRDHIPQRRAGDPHRCPFTLPSSPAKRFNRSSHANYVVRSIVTRFLRTRMSSPLARHHHLVPGARQTALDVPHGSQSPLTIRTNSPTPGQMIYRFPVGLRRALAVERKRIISPQMCLSSRGNKWVVSDYPPPDVEHPLALDLIFSQSWTILRLCARARRVLPVVLAVLSLLPMCCPSAFLCFCPTPLLPPMHQRVWRSR